jgi:hypothetical protein
MRRIASDKILKEKGQDERFFQSEDFVAVPQSIVVVLEEWCRKNGVANTALSAKGATSDDTLEVYYIPLGTKGGRAEFKGILKALAPALASSLADAASSLTPKNVLTLNANASVDELAALVALRDAVIRFTGKPSKAAGADPALIIYV